jgi:hypothetical protein
MTCGEQAGGKRFGDAKIKKMTRRPSYWPIHQDYFNIYSSHLILVLSNFRPAVREGGPAFRRRVRCTVVVEVPWDVPPHSKIKSVEPEVESEDWEGVGEFVHIDGLARLGMDETLDEIERGLRDILPAVVEVATSG